jgi:hypothetical protein
MSSRRTGRACPKLLGWDRYDSLAAVEAINDPYRQELLLSHTRGGGSSVPF